MPSALSSLNYIAVLIAFIWACAKSLKLIDFSFFFPALESKLVRRLCEDENGAVINNRITNGHWNGNNGHGKNTNEYSGYGNNGYAYGNNGYVENGHGNNDQKEIQNRSHTGIQGRVDNLPISADLLPLQVFPKNSERALNCSSCLCWCWIILHYTDKFLCYYPIAGGGGWWRWRFRPKSPCKGW